MDPMRETAGLTAPLFDTHLHLDHEQFEGTREEVLRRASRAGLRGILTVGITAGSSRAAVELARNHPLLHAAVGIQPNSCARAAEDDWSLIEELAGLPEVVALGETGLDRYWDATPFDLQQEYFERHIRLSGSTGLPLVIHMRDCGDDVVAQLEAARSRGQSIRGVMHSFTGDEALAGACLALGLHISFAGMVTYKKSEDLRKVAATIPEGRLLIETDAPYLSPHPHRGTRPNEPALVEHTARCLAEVRGVSFEELARVTTENAVRLFGLDDPGPRR